MSDNGMEQKYVKEAFEKNWVVPLGPNVDAFEYALEEYVNHKGKLDKRVVALSSGTAAVHLSLIALGVGPGDEDGPVGVNFFYLIVSLNRLILISTYSRTRHLFKNLTFVDGNSDYGHIVALHITKSHIHKVEDNPPLQFKEQFELFFDNLSTSIMACVTQFGTINPLTFGITTESQWVCLFCYQS